jgi:hypothetical protein
MNILPPEDKKYLLKLIQREIDKYDHYLTHCKRKETRGLIATWEERHLQLKRINQFIKST